MTLSISETARGTVRYAIYMVGDLGRSIRVNFEKRFVDSFCHLNFVEAGNHGLMTATHRKTSREITDWCIENTQNGDVLYKVPSGAITVYSRHRHRNETSIFTVHACQVRFP